MTGYTYKDQAFINKLTETVLANLNDKNFGVNDLARITGVSRHIIHHKLRSTNYRNVSRFIRETGGCSKGQRIFSLQIQSKEQRSYIGL